MNIVIDTSVWSLLLRRRQVDETDPYVQAFRRHMGRNDAVWLLGPVIQELLDGTRRASDFEHVQSAMESLPLIALDRRTYVSAARISNACRRGGVQARPVDALIAAACIENGLPLLTADRDFLQIARHCELLILPPLN